MFSLSSFTRQLGSYVLRPSLNRVSPPRLSLFSRWRGHLAPKQVKYVKRHKGRIPIPIGGSTKGTTLAYGEWGIRIKGPGARLSAKQLTTAQEVIIKKLKVLKGARVYLRVFPDIPVCIKVGTFVTILNILKFVYRETKPVWAKGKGPLSSGQLGKHLMTFLYLQFNTSFKGTNWSRYFRNRRRFHSRRAGS